MGEALWTQGGRFGTIGAKRGNRVYEITTFRAESYTDDSRKPPYVTYADEIEVDLSRRDFTVNAMALEVTADGAPTLVDPFGGAVDLMSKVLRTPLALEVSFSDDPLRMLAAARFIAGYDLQPTDELVAAATALSGRLEIVSAERIRDELDKLLTLDHPAAGLFFVYETGLAEHFLPELPGDAARARSDPSSQGCADAHDRRRRERPPAARATGRTATVRLPAGSLGGTVPRRRQAPHRGFQPGRGPRSTITTRSGRG